MKKKDLSKLIALAVLTSGVIFSRPALAYNYFYGNQNYSSAGGIDLSGVSDGIQLKITAINTATITFNGSSFNLSSSEWLPKTDSETLSYSRIAAINVASGGVGVLNGKTIIDLVGTISYDALNVYGGRDDWGVAESNAVDIQGGTFSTLDCIYGGYSYMSSANNNTVTISGGTLTGSGSLSIYGGDSDNWMGGSANNNKIIISGGTLTGSGSLSIYGGGSSSWMGGSANNNKIIISGGTLTGSGSLSIHGGCCYFGEVSNNTVALLGGTLNGTINVHGGCEGYYGSCAIGNTVIISDNVKWVKPDDVYTHTFNLYGYHTFGTIKNEGNTLIVDGKDITVTSAQNFNTYLFRVPEGIDGSTSMLNNTTAITLAGTETIRVTADQSTPDIVILANNVTGIVSGGVTYDLSNGNDITGGGVSISGTQLVYEKYTTVNRWTDVQPTTLNNNTVTVAGSKDASNPLAIVNGGTQIFVAGDSGKTEWQNVYGGYSSVQGAVAANNAVTISGSATVECDVYGGCSVNGDVIGNIVNIQGGEVKGNVYGGMSENASAIVSGNTINWSAGTIKGSEIRANNINITGIAAKYLGTAGTMTADEAAVLGDGKNAVSFTVGNGTDASALTFASGLDAKKKSTLTITKNSSVTLQGNSTLVGTVSGAGKVVIDGITTADADAFTQTGGVEVKNSIVFTSRGLKVSTVGGFTQTAGSNVIVPVSKIEADTNDPAKAMFTGVDDASKLNVSAGNLTLTGTVQEGKYYVLVAGTAVDGSTLTETSLWNLDNVTFDGVFNVKYSTNLTGNSIAIQVFDVRTFEEINTSGLAAVQQGNISVAKEFTGEVENHLGMIANPKLAEKEKYDKEVWASYIRTKETTEGMKLEGIEGNNTAQYNGAVVGVDFYTSRKAITGVAFSYTNGDIDGNSNGTFTRNKSKYYGVSFYNRVTNGNTALIYDISYIKGDNDISQFYTGKETTADVKTDTYTAGVRYEAEFGTKASRVVPFASFRYMRQNNKDYTNSHNTRFESSNQNLYIPKVGIAWTGDFAMPQSVWTWRPSVEAGYVWNLGDRSVDSNVFLGTGVAPIEYDIVDKSSYYAKAGMEFINKNFTAGVFYRYLKGDTVRNNKWNVNMSWAF